MHIPFLSSPFDLNPLLLLLTGFCVGTLSSFFGIGGGWLITPALHILGLPMPYAIGTSLVYIFITSILGTARHRKLKNVSFLSGLIIGTSSIAGVLGGKRLILHLEKMGSVDTWVRILYMLLLTTVGLSMLISKRLRVDQAGGAPKKGTIPPFITVPVDTSSAMQISLPLLVAIGLLVGALSSTMGVGGGFVLFPLLIYALGFPVTLAIGTSLFSVLITGAQGAVVYMLAGKVDWSGILYLTATTVIGIFIGSIATKRINPERIKVLFASTVLGGTLAVLFKQLDLRLIDSIVIFGIALGSTCAILYTAFLKKSREMDL
jgi:uncharacterized membrane protein YfcA